MDFKSWKEQTSATKSDSKTTKTESATAKLSNKEQASSCQNPKVSDFEKANLEAKLNEYSGKSEDELMKELFSTATKLKGEGKLKSSDLDAFYKNAKGFLTSEQLEKLQSLIKMLGV